MAKLFSADFYRVYLLPGIIFQSVLIGGGYATGREVVEFGGKFGAWGIWGILVIFLGFSLFAFLTYEVARIFKAYDYKTWSKELIFSLWPLFDILFVAITVLVLGVLGAATGSIVEEILGLPFWMGAALVLFLVVILNFYGKETIARFKTYGTLLLYVGYLIFSSSVIFSRFPEITESLASADTSYIPGLSLWTVLWAGILYVGYNIATLPTTLFILDSQTDRRHTLWSGIFTGVLAVIPFTLTWISLLGFYPEADVLDAPVPWIRMLSVAASPTILSLYGLIIVWTLVETCTGFIHAILDRIDLTVKTIRGRGLSRFQGAVIAGGMLISAGTLTRFGIIDLIAQGYTAMAYGFLVLMALPLLTVGVFRIFKDKDR